MQYTTYNLNNYFASTYGAGNYDSTTYQGSSNTITPASTSSAGVLTDTGFDISLIVTIAATLIFIALIIKFWKRPRSHRKEGTV